MRILLFVPRTTWIWHLCSQYNRGRRKLDGSAGIRTQLLSGNSKLVDQMKARYKTSKLVGVLASGTLQSIKHIQGTVGICPSGATPEY
jgi:hypothetical protein